MRIAQNGQWQSHSDLEKHGSLVSMNSARQESFTLSWEGDRIWQDAGWKREGQGCGFGRQER